jgi:hypothetical protein
MNSIAVRRLAYGLCAAGVALHSVTAFVMAEGPSSGFTLALLGFSCLPYAAMCLLVAVTKQVVPAAAGAGAALLADGAMFWSVFIRPTGSTAAVGLVLMPVWNLVLITPLAAALAYLLTRRLAARSQVP